VRRARPKESAPADTRVSAPSVEVVPTQAAELVEIHPTSKLWDDPARLPKTLAGMRGAIVKAQPPEGATDAQVGALHAALVAAGASHVRILPRKRAKRPVASKAAPAEPKARRDLRKAVQATLEASTYGDKDALRVEVEAALSAEGV
jgi:hypothetical protein